MGLMDWRLVVSVSIDGQDLTSRIRPMLSSLTITDEAGIESDELEIEVALGPDGPRTALPRTGAEIEVALGLGLRAVPMGKYIADEFEMSGPPDVLRVRARAAVYDSKGYGVGLQEQKSRSWDRGTTLGGLVSAIAGEHGMIPLVIGGIAGTPLEHLDQVHESDIMLLSRVCRDLDATLKCADAMIIVVKRGGGIASSGRPVPTFRIARDEITNWRLSRQTREVAGTVIAVWRDWAAAKDQDVIIGGGPPIMRLRVPFTKQDDAQRAAAAELRRRKSGEDTMSFQLPGRADLTAEAKVRLSGICPDMDREWLITRVTHQVSASTGWVTMVEGELPPG